MPKIVNLSNLNKTIRYLKKNGVKQAYYAAKERVGRMRKESYRFEPLSNEALQVQREKARAFSCRFSILVPAYETPEEYLKAMVDSVLNQTYGNFELIIADASESDRVKKVMASYHDERILYKRLKENGGISANTNQALKDATGDYAALLDHDDLLTPDALYEMALKIEESDKIGIKLQLLYSDEDKCDTKTLHFYGVHKKTSFNQDLLLSNNYICHFLVMERSLMQKLGFRSAYDGAQDFDLVLRAVHEIIKSNDLDADRKLPIAHVSKVLYHWRCHAASTAENPESKRYAYDAGKRAVEDFLKMNGWKGRVRHLRHLGFYRVDYEPDLFTNRPDVALIGGKLLNKKNQVAGGIYTSGGKALYAGLHKEYSGYMHRAVLQQEARVIDVRCMQASGEAKKVWEELMGVSYPEDPLTGRLDYRKCLKEDADYSEISRKFCEAIRKKNLKIVWDPAMTEKI
ncbi:MAG: glycosyltransferase [Lachnospiraceae bacterium]|nr:glycosyltransferase [Lachnospiraceae bacterium]